MHKKKGQEERGGEREGERGRERIKNTITLLLVKSECIAYMYIQKHALSYIRRFCNFSKDKIIYPFWTMYTQKFLTLLQLLLFLKDCKEHWNGSFNEVCLTCLQSKANIGE